MKILKWNVKAYSVQTCYLLDMSSD